MTERNPGDMEEFFADSLGEIPPSDEVVRQITPWRRAMTLILIGLGLTAVTLEFLGWMQYPLTFAGHLLLWLGFRPLRRENGFFRAGWAIAVGRMLFVMLTLVLNASIWRTAMVESDGYAALGIAAVIAQFVQALCLWGGLRKAKDAPVRAGMALTGWYLVLALLALLNFTGGLLSLALFLGSLLLILRSLCRLSGELEEEGYAITASPVKLSDRALALLLTVITLAGMGIGLACNRYPMEWNAVSAQQSDTIRDNLLSLGFPEEILADLSDEDIADCAGAAEVIVRQEDYPINEGRLVYVEKPTDSPFIYDSGNYQRVYDQKELRITGVAVRLAGEKEVWRLIHHFAWVVDPGFCGTEALQLWTADRDGSWNMVSGLSGRMLMERDGQILAAPYFSLGRQTYQRERVFFGSSVSADVFAAFSFPGGGEEHRGYVTYAVETVSRGSIIDSWINVVHQNKPVYPAVTAMDFRMGSGRADADAFKLAQTAIQFLPQ